MRISKRIPGWMCISYLYPLYTSTEEETRSELELHVVGRVSVLLHAVPDGCRSALPVHMYIEIFSAV